jgi:hypothetical protein
MALILGVKAGDRFYVGDTRVDVVSIADPKQIVLRVEGDGADHAITDKESVEILPSVFVSCGVSTKPGSGFAALPRIVIEAPRSITILRGELYERQHGKVRTVRPGGGPGPGARSVA